MRRIKLLFAAVAVVVAAFAAGSGPALADELNCRDARGNWIRCDGDLYRPVHQNRDHGHNYYNNYDPYPYYNYFFYPWFWFPPYYGYGFDDFDWD
jgi:hypothetical protein